MNIDLNAFILLVLGLMLNVEDIKAYDGYFMKLIEQDMKEIELEPLQNGYDVVAEYIERYWEHVSHDDVVLYIGISSEGEDYYRFKEIACVNSNGDVEFADDWWEGEKFIQLYGIKAISDIPISGGLFNE